MAGGMSKEEGIKQVYGGGGHVVIIGAGASIAATHRNSEKSGKKLPSMNDFIAVVGIEDLVAKIPGASVNSNFELLYSQLHEADPNSKLLKEIEYRINGYFGDMKLPDEPTIYDYLVLSLRGKDLIATFNWDPFLFQAFNRNIEFTTDLPHLSFLHGNVALGYTKEFKKSGPVGYCLKPNNIGYFEPTKLLYPVGQKNYNEDEFISMEWERVKWWLSKKSGAIRATIFGYGAPNSDVEAVKLLNQAWGRPDDRPMEQFEIIDIVGEDELTKRWKGFIHSHHYDVSADFFDSSLALNPRRTSESYFSHYTPRTISESFRHNNPVPQNFKSLQELWDWHKPLLDAEEKKAEADKQAKAE